MKLRKFFMRSKPFLVAGLFVFFLAGCRSQFPVLDPQGPVGKSEYQLIVFSAILIAVIVVPVLLILVYIVYRYRAHLGNNAPYTPEWADSKLLETVWWGIPILIVGVLGWYTVNTTFLLVKPPVKDVKPLTIQVISLDWKWLFQYPDQQIATVNYCEIPEGMPVQFVLTSDAPMNSFWVPQLGGQEYSMPGMAMRLWLQADKTGDYAGSGANFTGRGFAHMRFQVLARPQSSFNAWVDQIKKTSPPLTQAGYQQLKKPGVADHMSYSAYPPGLFNDVVNKNRNHPSSWRR